MKYRTKIEQISLDTLSKKSLKKVDIFIDQQKIDKELIFKAGKYLGTKSFKTIVDSSLSHLASACNTKGEDLLEQSNLDKLSILGSIQSRRSIKQDHKPNGKSTTVRVSIWKLMLIISKSKKHIEKEEELISYILSEFIKDMSTLFGETDR